MKTDGRLVAAVLAVSALRGAGQGMDGEPPPPDGATETVVVSAGYPLTWERIRLELDAYGVWMETDVHGWVWQPRIIRQEPRWRPYCHGGRWVWSRYGWYWYSHYPWGGIVFHYGRWVILQPHGWVWVPGYVWAPAWVAWRRYPSFWGWAPLPPRRGCGFALPPETYVFVSVSRFHAPEFYEWPAPALTQVTVVQNTTVVRTPSTPYRATPSESSPSLSPRTGTRWERSAGGRVARILEGTDRSNVLASGGRIEGILSRAPATGRPATSSAGSRVRGIVQRLSVPAASAASASGAATSGSRVRQVRRLYLERGVR